MLPIKVLRMRNPATTNLITNGTFATDTDWTKGTDWAIASGTANFIGGFGLLQQTISQVLAASLSASTNYRLTFTVTTVSGGGSVVPSMSGGSGTLTGASRNSAGTYNFDFTTGASAQTTVNFEGSFATGALSIDNIVLAPN